MLQGGFLRIPNLPSVFGGVVPDPFLGTKKSYHLFYSSDFSSWVWANGTSGDITFVQYWRDDLNMELVHYYPYGLNSGRPSAYDFQIF